MSIQAGNKVTRGERILSRLVEEDKISVQGKDWLICAIDPFHDHQLKELAGWPDVQSGASVVSCIKGSLTVRKPVAAPAGPWNCHIVQFPWLTASRGPGAIGAYTVMPRSGNVLSSNLAVLGSASVVGGLSVYYVPDGIQLDLTQGNGTVLIGRINVDQLYTDGVTRLIGLGHEIHNTTAMLNVQGAITCWRMMSNDNEPIHWKIQGTDVPLSTCDFSGPLVRYPPTTQAEAMLLSGSRQWEAKDGSYAVAAFHDIENPARLISPMAPVFNAAATADQEGFLASSNVYAPIPGNVVGPGTCRGMMGFRVHNFHMHGEILTGLSNETVLTINQNVFLEKFPATDDLEVLPLATLSAEYDPDVLDLYSRVVTELPVAVPVNENGLGDWFFDAASQAAKYIGPVLSALPHPMLKGAGMALTGLSDVMNQPKKRRTRQKPASAAVPPPNSWGVPASRKATVRAPRESHVGQAVNRNGAKVQSGRATSQKELPGFKRPRRRRRR